MKKFLKIIIISVLTLITACSLLACKDNGAGSTEKGLLCKKLDGVYTIYGYNQEEEKTELDIAKELETIYGETITNVRIKTNAFSGNSSLKKIIVPETVTEIDAGAFAGIKKLEELVLPFVGATANSDAFYAESEKAEDKAVDSERSIGHLFGTTEYALGSPVTLTYASGQTGTYYFPATLKKITIKTTVDYSIPMYAFSGAVNLNKIALEGKIDAIGENAFSGANGLTSITLPATVKTIYDSAFESCSNLNEVVFEQNSVLESIGANAFKGTKLGAEVKLPATVKTIGDYAFRNSGVKNVYLSSALEVIGDGAFMECAKLVNVYTDGVQNAKINALAFEKCTALDYVGVKASQAADTIDLAAFDTVEALAFANLSKTVTYNVIGVDDSQKASIFFMNSEK